MLAYMNVSGNYGCKICDINIHYLSNRSSNTHVMEFCIAEEGNELLKFNNI